MTRGKVIWVDLSDATPPEIGKRRPAVVVSNSAQNLLLDSVVGIPLSSRPPAIPTLRVRVHPGNVGAPSFAVVPGIRQMKKSRILREAGELSPSEMEALDQAVRDHLSD
jgi:mRNA interferase MazF